MLCGKTVIYGGSFNPPHMGHQMACLYLLEALGAAELWLVPSHTHPFGKDLAPFEDRVRMCEMLAAPFGSRVCVNLVESSPRASGRTYDTIATLQAEHPQRGFVLAVGADILHEAEHWYRWNDIQSRLPVVVVGRSGYASGRAPLELPPVASSDVRERLRRGLSIEGLVPHTVAKYVRQHSLYGVR